MNKKIMLQYFDKEVELLDNLISDFYIEDGDFDDVIKSFEVVVFLTNKMIKTLKEAKEIFSEEELKSLL